MCGCTDIVKQDGVFVCQGCGMKYSAEDAKALFADGNPQNDAGTGKNDKLNNLFVLARRARDSEDAVNAAKYYDMIQELDPDSWEALFYSVYFTYDDNNWATKCTLCLKNVFKLIETKIERFDKQTEAICEVAEKVMLRSDRIAVAARDEMLEKCNSPEYSGITQTAYIVYESKITVLPILTQSLGDRIAEFSDNKDFTKLAALAWKTTVNYAVNQETYFDESDYSDIIEKIKSFEPSYVVPQPNRTGYPQVLLLHITSLKRQMAADRSKKDKLAELKKEVRTVQTAKNQINKLNEENRANYKKVLCFSMLACFSCIVMVFSLSLFVLLFLFGIIGLSVFGNKSWKNSKRIKLLQEVIKNWDEIKPADSNSTAPAAESESSESNESSEKGIPSSEDLYISDPERVYLLARDVMEDDNIDAYEAALADFESIPDYKNARELAEKCRKRIEELENGAR